MILGAVVSIVLAFPRLGLAQTTPGSAIWQPASGASGDDTYLGAIDTPANGATLPLDHLVTVSGWFVDTTAEGWAGADDVAAYAGSMGNGILLTHGTVGLTRNDLVAATNNPSWASAGWSVVVDPAAIPGPTDMLSVYLHAPGKGWWYTQISVNVDGTSGGPSGFVPQGDAPVVVVTAPLPDEKVSIHLGSYRITGSARDPIGGGKVIDRIQVWLNGEHDSPDATYVGDADVNPDGTWELDFTPANYPALTSNLYVYAHSDLSNKTTLVVVHFELVNQRA
jgi:hypothetical protein